MLLLLYNTYPEHLVLYSIFAGSYMLVDKNSLVTSRKIFSQIFLLGTKPLQGVHSNSAAIFSCLGAST